MLKISKYMPQINAYCFRSMNKARTFLGLKPKSDYKLVSRADKLDISQIEKDKFWRVPKACTQFDYVVIGKKSDPNFTREVVSCYNSDGELISRYYRDNGINTRYRTYTYSKNHRTIKDYVFDFSNISKEFQIPHIINSAGRWNMRYSETQIKKIFKILGSDKTHMVLTTKRAEPLSENSQKYTFIQFPLNTKFEKKVGKRIFSAVLTKNRNDINISDIEHSDNLIIDKEDKFLIFRMLNPHSEEGIIALTKGFLKKLGLDGFNIRIITNSHKVPKNSSAYFSETTKEIHFNPDLPKHYILNIIDMARHEVEHAWQISLIGRLGKGKSAYATEALQKLGPIKNIEESNEAVKYAIAKDNYPVIKENEDLSKNIEYQTNYMEVKAREAAEEAVMDYSDSYDNFNFFEQFD